MDTRQPAQIRNKPIIQRLFGIPFNFTFVAASPAGTMYSANYTMSTNFDFLWELTGLFQNQTYDFTMNIRDEFTSEDMFVNPIYASVVTGNGQNQNILPRPYVFLGGTTITINVIDVQGSLAANMTAQISLIGYKIKQVRQ